MKQLNNNQLKQELLNILVEFDKICKENKIDYSLFGGTLIGAIRHKGFIPWDDDIDVVLTKENYFKLLKIINNYTGRYKFINHEINSEYYYPFLKMIDSSIILEEKYKKINNYGLYIDIFYYVNIPDNKFLLKMFWYKVHFYKFLISGFAYKKGKNIKHKFIKSIGKTICKIYGLSRVINNYERAINKYNNSATNNIMCNWPCYSIENEIDNKNNINDYILCDFENKVFPVFKQYDNILKNMYGDYMKLPKKENRVNHNLKGFIIKNEKEN